MKISDLPDKFKIPFGNSAGVGFIRPIPLPSQIGIQNGAASLTDGFPPLTFLSPDAGGYPPFGQDFNGILNEITSNTRWQNAGGTFTFDSDFASAIAGYPKGSILLSSTGTFLWLSTVDDNTNNPDSNPAGWTPLSTGRVRLTANLDVYVATTGSDTSGDGSSGNPWATIQHAVTYIATTIDLNGFAATVHVSAGTYAAGCAVNSPFVGDTGSVGVTILGDETGTYSNVLINSTEASCFTVTGGAKLSVRGFKLQSAGSSTPASGHAFNVAQNSSLNYGHINFGACAQSQVFISLSSVAVITQSCVISGGATIHLEIASISQIIAPTAGGNTITLTGTPAFSNVFVLCREMALVSITSADLTFSGSATGVRYFVTGNSLIDTNGSGANYFPGSTAGSTANGGLYV